MTKYVPDHQLRLEAALAAIAGERIECALYRKMSDEGIWCWSWNRWQAEATDTAGTEEEAIAAACRTLRAFLATDAAEKPREEIPRLQVARLQGALASQRVERLALTRVAQAVHEWQRYARGLASRGPKVVALLQAYEALVAEFPEWRRVFDASTVPPVGRGGGVFANADVVIRSGRARGGDGSTTPPGAPYGTGALCGRALCTAIEDRCGLLVGHPGPCEAAR